MASGDLDVRHVPQIALVSTPDATLTGTSNDNHFSSALSRPSPLLDSSRLTTSPSPSDNHGSPCSPVPILRSARYSLGSIRRATAATSTALCDNNPKERDGSPSYLSPNPQAHDRRRRGRKGTVLGTEITESSTERKTERIAAEDNPRFKLLSRAAHPDWIATATRTGVVHVDDSLDAGTSAGSRPSFVTSFFRRSVRRFRRPSAESDTGSDTARNGGPKGDNLTVRSKEAQLARPVELDLKPQQYSDLGLFQKRNIMDNLEERLEATKKLHREAVDLQTFYESGTVATMRNLRATVLPRPLPQDNSVFNEVDFVLGEIGQLYEELNKFWKEEIRLIAKALKEGRTDLRDLERWNNFHSILKQAIESWKNRPPENDAQSLRNSNMPSSTGIDLGAIASTLSSTMGSLEDALDRMSSTASLGYSQLGRVSFQRVYVAFAGNSDICLSFLRHCADYGESLLAWRLASIGLPTFSRVDASHDLRERSTGLQSEGTGVSARGLETLEGVGGGGALLRRRTHPTHNLRAGTPPIHHHASPHATLRSFAVSHIADKNPPTPEIVIIPPATEPVEDEEGGLGRKSRNISLQRPSQSLLPLRWLTLKDKALVLLSVYAIVSLSLSLVKKFGKTRSSEIFQ